MPRPATLREAVLLPANVFARLSMTQVLNQTSAIAGTIALHSFIDEAAAQAYLAGLQAGCQL